MRHDLALPVEYPKISKIAPSDAAIERWRNLKFVKCFLTVDLNRHAVGKITRPFGRGKDDAREHHKNENERFHLPSCDAAGGTGETYPITSINRPTPMNDTMRCMPPTFDKSTKNSLTTTTPIKTAPASQRVRSRMRVAINIAQSAIADQKIEKAACTVMDRIIASNSNGTPAQ